MYQITLKVILKKYKPNGEIGWIVEFVESQYINVSTYRPLSGSSYTKLPVELKVQKKN